MPRRRNMIYTNYGLPEGSDALTDLDAFCEEWGDISRADATQRLIIAWSKMRRGQFGEAWGFTPMSNAPVSSAPAQPEQTPPPAPLKRRVTNGNVSAVELD